MGTAQNKYPFVRSGVWKTCFEECIGLPALPSAPDSFRYWVVCRPRLKNYLSAAFDAFFEEGPAEGRLTYFEFVTAAAFAWFAERAVDLAVVEVGLGGRLQPPCPRR